MKGALSNLDSTRIMQFAVIVGCTSGKAVLEPPNGAVPDIAGSVAELIDAPPMGIVPGPCAEVDGLEPL